MIYDRIKKIYKSGDEEVPISIQKNSSHSINGRPHNEHKSINKEESYGSQNPIQNQNQDESFTPVRHSTGKMKTASYSSSCSSFTQFQNAVNNATHGTYNSFYNSTNQDLEDSSKIQKKSSLK